MVDAGPGGGRTRRLGPRCRGCRRRNGHVRLVRAPTRTGRGAPRPGSDAEPRRCGRHSRSRRRPTGGGGRVVAGGERDREDRVRSWIQAESTGGAVQLAVREATGAVFAGPTEISGASLVRRSRLVVGDDGVVIGGWVEQLDGGNRVVGVIRANDGTVTAAPVSATDVTVDQLDAVVDQSGTVTLAWKEVEASAGSQRVSATRRSAGRSFEPPVALSDRTGVPIQRPVLGVDPTGDVTVVYSHGTLANSAVHVLRSQVLDVNAPALTATVPTTGTAGQLALDERRPRATCGVRSRWPGASVTARPRPAPRRATRTPERAASWSA